ncbi:uncharacterized protein LOC132262043 [Phlebotomus argentipes]|uniref:uncharacterized protein LOC132262043 n=1 Tax=Phlebotomus argentipes TaxID=94469 RepID=UPI0028934451|nr:uncharacterized protein LOC132262043 [Phlebotomus argentipes]
MLYIVVLVLSVVILPQSSAQSPEKVDWCGLEKDNCDQDVEHVACFDPETDPKFCHDVKLLKLTDENRQEIVKRYNEYRNRVAGGEFPGIPFNASRMIQVKWDDTLEYLAGVELQRCKSSYFCRAVPNRLTKTAYQYHEWNTTKPSERLGQSFSDFDTMFGGFITSEYEFMDSQINCNDLIVDVESNKVRLKNAPRWDHLDFYLKNIDETAYIFGCAMAYTPTWEDHDGQCGKVYVKYICNFMFTEQYSYNTLTYNIGPACSECESKGMRCSKDYPNLCEIYKESSGNVVDSS